MPVFTASLPMYNLPEMRPANAAFWRALSDKLARAGLGDLPDTLEFARGPVPAAIGATTLFTQTCGYPLQTIYRGQYQLLGVPSYDAPGCGAATHRAFLLVHEDAPFHTPADLRGAVFALNSRHSNSGMNLPRVLLAPLAGGRPFFGKVVETGGHNASIERLAAGAADVASIDCLTYAFFKQHRPGAVARLRILAETTSSPAIPFVTAVETEPRVADALRQALHDMAADPALKPVLAGLRIRTIEPVAPDDYAVLMDYERQAASLCYPELA